MELEADTFEGLANEQCVGLETHSRPLNIDLLKFIIGNHLDQVYIQPINKPEAGQLYILNTSGKIGLFLHSWLFLWNSLFNF